MTSYDLELIQEQGEADKIQPSEFEAFVNMMTTRQTHLFPSPGVLRMGS